MKEINASEKILKFYPTKSFFIFHLTLKKFFIILILVTFTYPITFFYRYINTKNNGFTQHLIIFIIVYLLIQILNILFADPIKTIEIDINSQKINLYIFTLFKRGLIKKTELNFNEIYYKIEYKFYFYKTHREVIIFNKKKKYLINILSTSDFDEYDIDKIEKIFREHNIEKKE